jgi:type IV pilus assembly protein PilE
MSCIEPMADGQAAATPGGRGCAAALRLPTRGFTLIELLIAIAIVAILSSIAVPSYMDYLTRGKLAEATAGLANMRVKMEQYFQDNKTFDAVASGVAPCTAGSAVPPPENTKYFTFTCEALSETTFTVRATGTAPDTVGFEYTINQDNLHTTDKVPAGSGYETNATCWVVRKGSGAKACS